MKKNLINTNILKKLYCYSILPHQQIFYELVSAYTLHIANKPPSHFARTKRFQYFL